MKTSELTPEEWQEFQFEMAQMNLSRTRTFGVSVAFFILPLIAIDYHRLTHGVFNTVAGYKYLFYHHLNYYAIALPIIVLAWNRRSKLKNHKLLAWQVLLSYAFPLFALIWMALVSTIDQLTYQEITAFILGIFGVASIFYHGPRAAISVFLIGHAIFLVGLFFTQADPIRRVNFAINGTAGSFVAFILSRILAQAKLRDYKNRKTIEKQNRTLKAQKEVIELEKRRADHLLQSILPAPIVRQLNEDGYTSVLNSNLTVVFTDIVSFSQMAEALDPRLIVSTLDKLFNSFDETVRNRNLEKLKTMGDGYMFAGGLFQEDNQLEDALAAAFDILQIVQDNSNQLKAETGFDWLIRVGIHTGPAVTGVIGKWRFSYDLWGNTVNIASRLEGASLPNRINTSNLVYQQLKNHSDLRFNHRGLLSIKNMQPVDMYFVERKSFET